MITMKPRLFIPAALLLVLIPGCSRTQKTFAIAEAGSWQDGLYTKTAEGRNGNFPVYITIENGFISAIDAEDNRETPEKGGKAISVMIPKMISAQSYDVDIVSGATITSDALENAVAEALEEASRPAL